MYICIHIYIHIARTTYMFTWLQQMSAYSAMLYVIVIYWFKQ